MPMSTLTFAYGNLRYGKNLIFQVFRNAGQRIEKQGRRPPY